MTPVASAQRYFGILSALLRREQENRRRSPFESIATLIEPIFMIAMLSTLSWFMGRKEVSPLGGPSVLFYATGFFPYYFFVYVSRRMKGAIDAPVRRFPIEQRLDHIIVHIILRMIDYTILGIILFGTIYLFFTPEGMPDELERPVAAMASIAALGFGWGTLNLVMSKSRLWSFLMPSLSRVLLIFSGVMFVPDLLPPDTRYVLSFNPLLHAVALFKLGFYPQYTAIILDKTYLAYSSLIAVFIGLVLERVTRRNEGR